MALLRDITIMNDFIELLVIGNYQSGSPPYKTTPIILRLDAIKTISIDKDRPDPDVTIIDTELENAVPVLMKYDDIKASLLEIGYLITHE